MSHRGGSDGLFQKLSVLRWPLPRPPEGGGAGGASLLPRLRVLLLAGVQLTTDCLWPPLRPVCTCREGWSGGRKGSRSAQAWPGAAAGGEGLALSLSFLATAQEWLLQLSGSLQPGTGTGVFLGVVGPPCRHGLPSAPLQGPSPMASSGRAPGSQSSRDARISLSTSQAACGAGNVRLSPALYSRGTEAGVEDVVPQTQPGLLHRAPPGLRPHARSVGRRPRPCLPTRAQWSTHPRALLLS